MDQDTRDDKPIDENGEKTGAEANKVDMKDKIIIGITAVLAVSYPSLVTAEVTTGIETLMINLPG